LSWVMASIGCGCCRSAAVRRRACACCGRPRRKVGRFARGTHAAADDAVAAALRPFEELIRERAGVNCVELRLDGKHMVVTGPPWSKRVVDRAARAVLRRSVKIWV